jgi:uncharacterized protein (TIGR02452 family)
MSVRTHIPRDFAIRLGQEAVRIVEAGHYTAPPGRVVDIAEMVARSVAGTQSYPPGQALPESTTGSYATTIDVVNDTTLAAALHLKEQGYNLVVLNFASATEPGGGFLDGARAQEEYLARSSGLFACLRGNPMYAFHRARHNPLYSNYAIYSPGVPVFRADDHSLLEEPYTVGIITSPAVLAKHVGPTERPQIEPAMWTRILKVLSAGLVHGHDAIVLGAWGCGAFGNDGHLIAGLFHKALVENFAGAYTRVIFAIVDWSEDRKFISPFEDVFGKAVSL